MPRLLRKLTTALTALGLAVITASAQVARRPPAPAHDEVFYQIFVRSFRDSNGDTQGDLKGIEQQLGYLQQLGVTTLLLTPIGPSPFYHNYFLDDFGGIDRAFGTEQEFRQLVRALHRRGMQLFLDMELQYVSGNHVWFRESFQHPGSRFSQYLLYDGPDNARYETGFWEKPEVPTYDGKQVRIATVNLLDADVQKLQLAEFTRWMLPTAPGRNDGVDGFRIDHMQDNLDNHGKLTELFARFWTPLFRDLKRQKPGVRILAEQADWGFGEDWLGRGNADMVFAFPMRKAIVSFDKPQLVAAINETQQRTPAGKQQVLFIENHDTDRFASETGGDLRKTKAGAALNLLLQGIPLIYYGQELGMTGRHIASGSSDGGDIPQREAFPWTARVGPGMAVWYRNSGPWWDASPLATGGGVSLESQRGQPDSLLAYYQTLLALRRSHPAFITGDQALVANDNAHVLSFVRVEGAERMLVVVNLANAPVTVSVETAAAGPPGTTAVVRSVLDARTVRQDASGHATVPLGAYGVNVFTLTARP